MPNEHEKYNAFYNQKKANEFEKRLSFGEKLFSFLSFLRGARRITRWACVSLVLAIVYIVTHSLFVYLCDTYSHQDRSIAYSSQYGILTKHQVIDILGINTNTNFSALPLGALQSKLNHHPAIRKATINVANGGTLSIHVEEHVPLLFIEMADKAITGKSARYCLSPERIIFAYDPIIHTRFNQLPTWLLRAADVKDFSPGHEIAEEKCAPIIELARAANAYSDRTELPSILTIERPTEHALQWRLIFRLETGTTVEMSTLHNIPDQLERLVKVLNHARGINKKVISTCVAPEKYVPAVLE